jgi:23S rRNA (adenine2030-N6)-methyltransferase
MFSYRHAFHAGNHADVLKHMALVAVLRHLALKDTAFSVLDTHAGAGLYRLDGQAARTSGEAGDGVLALLPAQSGEADESPPLPAALADYLGVVQDCASRHGPRAYPGSPFITAALLRPDDRLKACEVHPTDAKLLAQNLESLGRGRQITALREDGFGVVRKFWPPPSRRGLRLCDPSYEIKSDYERVPQLLEEALKRFATGVAAVWHPIIPRPEAHQLPKRLKALAQQAGKPWLYATLAVGGEAPKRLPGQAKAPTRLRASGVFIVNPPHTLAGQLRAALPVVTQRLGKDRHAGFQVLTQG